MATKDPFEAIQASQRALFDALNNELAIAATAIKGASQPLAIAAAREYFGALMTMLKQNRVVAHRLSSLRDARQSPTLSVVQKRALELMQFQMKQNAQLNSLLQFGDGAVAGT
jgi:hypothetical protein